MFRVANLVMVVALLLTAAVVYQLKYASTAEAERLATLRAQIRKERDTIALLKAEWARRTSPIYIQGLVERHLDLQGLQVEAISNLADLPERPAGGGDGIGGMIEALVDAPLLTSSVGKATASTPGAGTSAPPATSALRAPSGPPRRPSPSAAPARPQAPRAATPAPAAPPEAQAEPAPVAQAPAANPLEQFFSWARQPVRPAPAPQAAPPPQPAPSGGGNNWLAPLLPPGGLPGAR